MQSGGGELKICPVDTGAAAPIAPISSCCAVVNLNLKTLGMYKTMMTSSGQSLWLGKLIVRVFTGCLQLFQSLISTLLIINFCYRFRCEWQFTLLCKIYIHFVIAYSFLCCPALATSSNLCHNIMPCRKVNSTQFQLLPRTSLVAHGALFFGVAPGGSVHRKRSIFYLNSINLVLPLLSQSFLYGTLSGPIIPHMQPTSPIGGYMGLTWTYELV